MEPIEDELHMSGYMADLDEPNESLISRPTKPLPRRVSKAAVDEHAKLQVQFQAEVCYALSLRVASIKRINIGCPIAHCKPDVESHLRFKRR